MQQVEVLFISSADWVQTVGLKVELDAGEDGATACALAILRGGSEGTRNGNPVGAIVVESYQSGAFTWARRKRYTIDPLSNPSLPSSWVAV